MRSTIRLCLFGASLGLSAAAMADSAAPRRYGELSFEPCSLTAQALPTAVEAQCTTLRVPENRADPQSRQIELALAWIPASGDAEPDPVFMLAGGPGQAAREAYPMVHAAFRDLRRSRHVLLLDARGTGGSHPLVCRDRAGKPAVSDDIDDGIEQARGFAERCASELGKDADLRYYTTGEHIDDIEQVRQMVGARQVNLVGISYGTRVAQQYALRYPQQVRSIVLDSVVPNSLVLGAEHAANLEAALNTQFERCRAVDACLRQLGDPRAQLDAVRARLQSGELAPVRFRDARSGEWKEAIPRFGHLALLLRMYAYSPETASLLPWLLHEAAEGRFEALLAQAAQLEASLTGQIYHGMQLSVLCSEDDADMPAEVDADGTVLGSQLMAFSRAQCSVWPRGTRDPRFREALTGELPMLLLSGEYDPVTPPRYADEVAKSLPRARHLLLKGQGHSVLGLGCAPKLLAQFVESADASTLDASCLDRLRPLPPFAGAYGWEP